MLRSVLRGARVAVLLRMVLFVRLCKTSGSSVKASERILKEDLTLGQRSEGVGAGSTGGDGDVDGLLLERTEQSEQSASGNTICEIEVDKLGIKPSLDESS